MTANAVAVVAVFCLYFCLCCLLFAVCLCLSERKYFVFSRNDKKWKNSKINKKEKKATTNGKRGKRIDFFIDCHTLSGSQ
jgi:hypothetical protein